MRLKRLLLPAILLLVSVFVKAQKSNEFTVLQWNVWQEGTMSLMELHVKNELPGDEKVEEGDELVCYGKYRDFQSFWKAI